MCEVCGLLLSESQGKGDRGEKMKAMVLKKILPVEKEPLKQMILSVPIPGPKEILIRISACGVCHTELDEIEGRLAPNLPIILGHEVVGRVERLGLEAKRFQAGDRVGITWIYSACGECHF